MPPRKRKETDGETPKKKKAASGKIAKTLDELPVKDPEVVAQAAEKNKLIIDLLVQMGNKLKGEDNFKSTSYFKAVNAIKKNAEVITSGKEAKRLPFIGDSIAKKIDEILETGKLSALEEEAGENKKQEQLAELEKLGIDQKKARELVNDGVDLEKADETGLLSPVEMWNLKYRQDFANPVSVEKAQEIFDKIKMEAHLVGGHRRETEDTTVNILLNQQKLTKKDQTAIKEALETKDLAQHNDKEWIAVVHESHAIKIVLHLVPEGASLGARLIYTTGSQEFYNALVQQALEAGLYLDDLKLADGKGTAVDCPTEESLFEKINYDYLDPKDRSW
ncbi:hypothetical protein EDD86DRAFT_213892 [Gorgonomyces haynaldii]|nr:hypothetical protein EDD86DRAFT_213892 [Gorgonomyces haynaldii]